MKGSRHLDVKCVGKLAQIKQDWLNNKLQFMKEKICKVFDCSCFKKSHRIDIFRWFMKEKGIQMQSLWLQMFQTESKSKSISFMNTKPLSKHSETQANSWLLLLFLYDVYLIHSSLVDYLAQVKKSKNYPTHSDCVLSYVWVYMSTT